MTGPDGWGEHQQRLQHLVAHAAWLVELISAQGDRDRRIDRAAFAEGYRLGFAAVGEDGYGRAHEEIARDWARLAAKIRQMAHVPTFAELLGAAHAGFTARRAPDGPNGPAAAAPASLRDCPWMSGQAVLG